MKRKRTIYKALFISTASSSIVISVVLASVAGMTIPPAVIPILSITSGILTGLGAKFGFQDKKRKIKQRNPKTE